MTRFKKQAKVELLEFLKKHHRDVNSLLMSNKREIAKLTEKQTVLKRKKAEIDALIRTLEINSK